jgi:hypothetical protein
LKARPQLEECAQSHPSALSSKQPQIVTRPDVEHALILWVWHMEEKGKTLSGLMLRAKHVRFKDWFDVPEGECLLGEGWVALFCKAYRIKEHHCHREAASVNSKYFDKVMQPSYNK